MTARVCVRGLGCKCGGISFKVGVIDSIEHERKAACVCGLSLRPLDLVYRCNDCDRKFCFVCVYETLTDPDERAAEANVRESTKQLHRHN